MKQKPEQFFTLFLQNPRSTKLKGVVLVLFAITDDIVIPISWIDLIIYGSFIVCMLSLCNAKSWVFIL